MVQVRIQHAAADNLRSTYAPIVGTLLDGFFALGCSNVSLIVLTNKHACLVNSGFDGTAAHSLDALGFGDLVVHVGLRLARQQPWQRLRARGVRTVLYVTDATYQLCWPVGFGIDEVWSYTRRVLTCTRGTAVRSLAAAVAHRRGRPVGNASHPELTYRYLPPGFLGRRHNMLLGRHSDSHAATKAFELLGDDGTFRMRKLKLCLDQITAELHVGFNATTVLTSTRRASHASAQTMLDDAVGLNLHTYSIRARGTPCEHSCCNDKSVGFEALDAASWLSSGRRLLSARSFRADEREFAGFVDFVEVRELSTHYSQLVSRSSEITETERQERIRLFGHRFEPQHLLTRAAVTQLVECSKGSPAFPAKSKRNTESFSQRMECHSISAVPSLHVQIPTAPTPRGAQGPRFALALHGRLGTLRSSSSRAIETHLNASRRLIRYCALSIRNFIVYAQHGHPVDVFIHSWNIESGKFIDEQYGPPHASLHEEVRSGMVKGQSQALSIARVSQLIVSHEQRTSRAYTLVLVMRLDVVLATPFRLTSLDPTRIWLSRQCCLDDASTQEERTRVQTVCGEEPSGRLVHSGWARRVVRRCRIDHFRTRSHDYLPKPKASELVVMDWWFAASSAVVESWRHIALNWSHFYVPRAQELRIAPDSQDLWSHFAWALHLHEVLRMTAALRYLPVRTALARHAWSPTLAPQGCPLGRVHFGAAGVAIDGSASSISMSEPCPLHPAAVQSRAAQIGDNVCCGGGHSRVCGATAAQHQATCAADRLALRPLAAAACTEKADSDDHRRLSRTCAFGGPDE